MDSGRVPNRIGNANSSKELSVEKVQGLWEGAPKQDMSNSLLNGQDIWRRNTKSSQSREAQRKDKDTLVVLVRSFMRLNMRVKQAGKHAGGTVAPLY